jgi:anti-sigma-K factor RskA
MNRPHHLSDDELISLLYGLGDTDGHLARCPECAERWNAMHRALGIVRTKSARAAVMSEYRLAAQRQQIRERLGNSSSRFHSLSWIPAAAAAALLAIALFLQQHHRVISTPIAAAVVTTEGDAALFTDVYSMEQDVEPRAAAPIRALFQEASFEEERQ